MIIERLTLKNYRQYRECSVEFAPAGKRGFTVIQGANGAGKTNILNAITWCLYGKEYHLSPKYQGLPIYHASVSDRLAKGQSSEVQVEMLLRETEGQKVIVTRTLKFRAEGAGKISIIPDSTVPSQDGSRLAVLRQIKRDMAPVTDPQFVVQKLIPEEIEEYFLFDGERLNDYFRETSGQQIRDAVFKISQLGLLERLIDHLSRKEREFIQDQKNLSPQAERVRKEMEVYQKSVEELEAELTDYRKQKGEAEKKERELSDHLKAIAPENIGKLQDERVDLEKDIDHLNGVVGDLEDERLEALIAAAPAVISLPALLTAKELIEQTEESGEIPPAYRQSFLQKLLKEGRCICGTELSKGSHGHSLVDSLSRKVSALSELSTELIEENGNLRKLLTDTIEFPGRLKQVNDRIGANQAQLKRKNERLLKVQELIGSSDMEAVKQTEEQLQRFKTAQERLIAGIASSEYRLEEERKTVTRLQAELEGELEKEDRNKELMDILKFCQNGLEVAQKIKSQIMVDVRNEIAERTRRYFLGLIWKKDTFADVKIDENYNVSVIHQSGLESLGTLSAGERQVLALSFVAALNSVSGFDVPIIIDTPLGRISREPRHRIASSLPEYLEGKQVVLLVTEEEYTAEVRDALKSATGREWLISYHERKTGAEAEVGPYER